MFESASRGGVEREREIQDPNRLSPDSRELDVGLELKNCEIMTWTEVNAQPTEPPRCPGKAHFSNQEGIFVGGLGVKSQNLLALWLYREWKGLWGSENRSSGQGHHLKNLLHLKHYCLMKNLLLSKKITPLNSFFQEILPCLPFSVFSWLTPTHPSRPRT